MRLSHLSSLPLQGADVEITGLTEDSRKVKPGFLFIATPGTKLDGNAFIEDAKQKGAVAVLLPTGAPLPEKLTSLASSNIRKDTAALAAAFYPQQPETIVAVTGTSGKTSTAQFTREIWEHLGYQSASIGTLGLVTAKGSSYGSLTTPDAITMHHLLDNCAKENITHAAIEASSHGIEFNRLDQVKLKAGGFTNFSRDHLDYHQNMEAYLAAKLGLFSRLLPHGATAVLNADIPEFDLLSQTALASGLKIISYGWQGKELRLIESKAEAQGQALTLEVFGKSQHIMLPIIGDFQVWNGLCAAGMAIGSGSNPDTTIAALEKVTGVPGRMQYIGTSLKGGIVFVDYAHKPDALENVLRAMRPHVSAHHAKLGVVFGCGGNRDTGKRPLMGAIAQKNADWVIVSDDNPRHEDAATIRSEIMAGCVDKSNVDEMGDRAKAIAEAIQRLESNDILIIAGKGHEPGQIVGDTILPFDDAAEAQKVLGS